MYKQAKWSDIKALFAENPTLVEDTEAVHIRIEALLNLPKVMGSEVRGASDELLKKDEKDAWANLGMAFFYLNAKKADLDKALKHLETAKAAKTQPPGVSSLYWTTRLKKQWWMLALLVGGLIAAGDSIRRRRKKPALITIEGLPDSPTPPAEPSAEPAQPPTPPTSGFQKILGKIKDFLQKLKKKPAVPAAPSEETPDPNSEPAAQEVPPAAEPPAEPPPPADPGEAPPAS